MSSPAVYLPLSMSQVIEMIRQLPHEQKQQIVDVLLEENIVPESQKDVVRARIKKYKDNPYLLLSEEAVWDSLNAEE